MIDNSNKLSLKLILTYALLKDRYFLKKFVLVDIMDKILLNFF